EHAGAQDGKDARLARRIADALLAFGNAGEPENARAARAVAHEAPVARLEHVQRDLRARQEHHPGKREDGEPRKLRSHALELGRHVPLEVAGRGAPAASVFTCAWMRIP